MEIRNARSGEDAWDPSLSGRLPARETTRFKWQDGGILQIQADVGTLGVLPLETIHCILQQLDLASLSCLKRTSHGMSRAVSSLPKLRAIVHCAPDALRAIWASKAGSLVECAALYEQLCRPTCVMCNFLAGTYLYILSCHRVCQQCLLGRERYLPLRPKQASSQFGLPKSSVRRLPRLYVPKYSPQSRSLRRWGHILKQRNTTGWVLIDREVVLREQLRNAYGSSAICRELLLQETRQQIAQLHERRLDTGTAQTPFTAPTEYSYSVSVLFPWLDRATQNVGRPEKCRACRFEGKSEALSFHCATGLKDHIDQHGPIVDGQHVKPSSE